MHATHQFFLTKRSLYLLVLNARQDEDENRLEYWLKIIQSFGGTSPIIIVGNQVDQQPLDIDRRGLQTKYPQIQAIVETSCETGEGIDALRSLITQEVDALEHIYDPLPLSWFTLKQQLEAIEHDYIPYTEYQQLCNTQGITDDLSQTTLVGFLHDLGIVLNFCDDPRLEDTHVLNPQWVTNGVYRILNDNPLITEHRGILDRTHLTRILDRSRYPRSKHLFIIDMMRKFELCFDLDGCHDQKFLLPDLLTKEEPYTGDWNDALPFQYHYKVLPTSIISRFIVRMNNTIHQHTYWRNGVVLAYENNIALIKADREDKKIFIRVTGTDNGRRRFLTVIRAQFAAIHQTIPGLDVDEKIPLLNYPDIEPIDYLHLLTLEELGETSFIPTGLKERISVQSLLDGIESVQERRGKRDRADGMLNVRSRPPISEPRDQVFISYSHQDKEWLGKLQTHLKPLIRKHKLSVWDDTKITAGAEWYKEIEAALATAKVAVLLVSPNFLASDFINDEELPPLLDAAATDGLTIIWVHLRHSAYRETDISKYQAAHDPSHPLNSLNASEHDQALVSICQKIKDAMA
jgi:internalin A